ncbi:MAG: sugar transferase [Calothrix sp. MO_167.B42]|nr:sugar transferase [Calothrix sp. MO_167.B42]
MSLSFTNRINSPGNTRLLNVVRSLPVLLLLGDIFGVFICLAIAHWLRLGEPLYLLDPLVCGFALLVLTGLYLADAYHPETQIVGLRAPYRILLGMVVVALFTSALIYLSGAWWNNTLTARGVLLLALVIFTIWAVMLRVMAVKWLRSHARQSNWLILGADENAIQLVQKLLALNPLGRLFVLAEPGQDMHQIADSRINYLGPLSDLSVWNQKSLSAVILASHIKFSESQLQQLMQMRLQGIPIYRLSDFYESLWYKIPSSILQKKWLTFSAGFNLMSSSFSMRIKRFGDIILTSILLVILFPIMLLTALLIKLDSPGSVFYSQIRTGQNGQTFRVYKFRSMYENAEKQGAKWAEKRDARITRVGYWLRLTRIDELPQIWNVLRGDMSLIGPRPERPEFDVQLKEAIPYYELRYLVKPGITGWAQVLYPYGASVEDAYEKLAYDLYYIKNYSIWLDLAIAFKTIRVILLGKGR